MKDSVESRKDPFVLYLFIYCISILHTGMVNLKLQKKMENTNLTLRFILISN